MYNVIRNVVFTLSSKQLTYLFVHNYNFSIYVVSNDYGSDVEGSGCGVFFVVLSRHLFALTVERHHTPQLL